MQYRFAIATLAALASAASFVHAADNPYAGQERRSIKALSEQEIADYRHGRGMRTSLAAELNHYPGPRHVLEHVQALDLSQEQQARTRQLQGDMAREAVRLGERIVQKEAELEALFAGGKANHDSMRSIVGEIGMLQAEYRAVHLGAHLSMRQILSSRQIAEYDRLRSYGGTNPAEGGHKHGMMHGKMGRD